MDKITLKRTGDRPLSFVGSLIGDTSTQRDNGIGESRYWKLALYLTDQEGYVFLCSYRSRWEIEHGYEFVESAKDLHDVIKIVKGHDFLRNVNGFPKGHEEKQRNLLVELRRCWEAGISDLFDSVPVEPEFIELSKMLSKKE
jgi:hypothetical protein